MKKLFIIGNGFDLAHELPTSYGDLIAWYENETLNELKEVYKKEDEFFKISLIAPAYGNPVMKHQVPSDFSTLISEGFARPKGVFFNLLLNQYRQGNWIDIERLYFQKLKDIIESKNRPEHKRLKLAKELNSELQSIQDLLERYLSSIEKRKKPELIQGFKEILQPSNQKDQYMYLTFNYTSTLKYYFEELKNTDWSEIVNIHGELRSSENPIIFGYGDQHNEVYSILENLNENEYLRFIKYPKYTLSDGFQKLSRFLTGRQQPYEVHIIGHSCGLSDRTLFKEILDSDMCERVYLHHYQDRNDFFQKSMELTRHFDDKINHIRKIQPFNESLRCPQHSDT